MARIEVIDCEFNPTTKTYVGVGIRKKTNQRSLFESQKQLLPGTLVHEDNVSEQSISPDDGSMSSHVEWDCMKHALLGFLYHSDPKQALVLGLGNATVPRFIAHHNPECEVLSVEYNAMTDYMARKHFGYTGSTVIGDALKIVKRLRPDSFDYIFLDCFGGDEDLALDSQFSSPEFVATLYKLMRKDCILAVNQGSTESEYEMAQAVRFQKQMSAYGFSAQVTVTAHEDSDECNQILITGDPTFKPGR